MALPAELGPIGAIPVIGPIIIGVIGIVDIFGALFGITFGQSEVSKLAEAVQELQTAVAAAIQQTTALLWTIAYAFGKLLQWVHDAFVGFLTTLWNLLKKLAGWMQELFTNIVPKLLNVIQRLRQFLNQIYLKYIRPVLVWIQYLRKWLAILRIFHIGWATKLDQWLVKLQGRIIGPYLYVLRTINGIGTWVNVIITARGVIQRAVFINTMYAYQADWINMWWTGQTLTGAGTPPAAPVSSEQGPPLSQVSADFSQWVTTGTGNYADAAARSNAAFDAAMSGTTVV